jgi:hypothetical protein
MVFSETEFFVPDEMKLTGSDKSAYDQKYGDGKLNDDQHIP